jgi:hypothetical protein
MEGSENGDRRRYALIVTGDKGHIGDREASGTRRGGRESGRAGSGQGETLSSWPLMALSLQRTAGNQAVCRMLQRGKGGGKKAEREAADKARRKAQQQVREASAAAAMKQKLDAGQAKREAAAAEAARNAERAKQKAARVREIAVSWRAEIGGAVDQVKALRREKLNEGWGEDRVMGINAGSNPGSAPIPGGTKNPITFTVPRNEFGITKADVSTSIPGFDSSDSGLFKFRMAEGIFIHGQ